MRFASPVTSATFASHFAHRDDAGVSGATAVGRCYAGSSGRRELGWQVAGGIVLWTMKKTSIYLGPAVDRALVRRAAAEGTTKAALIRAALAAAAAPVQRAIPRACGLFDGPGDLAPGASTATWGGPVSASVERVIVLDTSVALAFMDRRDADHERVREWMQSSDGGEQRSTKRSPPPSAMNQWSSASPTPRSWSLPRTCR